MVFVTSAPWFDPANPSAKGWRRSVLTRGPNDKKQGKKYYHYKPPVGNVIRSYKQARLHTTAQVVKAQAARTAATKTAAKAVAKDAAAKAVAKAVANDAAAAKVVAKTDDHTTRNIGVIPLDIIHNTKDKRKKTQRHGVKMLQGGMCPYCSWTNINNNGQKKCNSAFDMHITMDHKDKVGFFKDTYHCNACNKSFKSRSILNNHNQNKHSNTIFTSSMCDCGSEFKNVPTLLVHLVSKHLNLKERDCITSDGCCVVCNENRVNKTSHKYHYAICIGLKNTVTKHS